MTPCLFRALCAACVLALAAVPSIATAQQPPSAAQQGQPGGKDAPKKDKENEFAEAARVLGGPAANPECVWIGRRMVGLLTRDDLDTAFRHLDLYDRFGCPGGHIQSTFRCVLRQGAIDAKAAEALNARVHQCWINPDLQPPPAATAGQAQPSQSTGTNPQ